MARPNLSYLKSVFLFLFGLPCGALTGLTGMGSSVLALPGVRWLLGLRPNRASATALAATFCGALAALLSYAQGGDVRWGLAVLLAIGQLFGAAWGTRLALQRPKLTTTNVAWAFLAVAGGLAMMAHGAHGGLTGFAPTGAVQAVLSFVVAALVGVVSRLAGLGGILLVPAEFYLLGLPSHVAQGTAIFVLLLASLPGALIHARRGDVEPQSATWVSLGAIFGGLVGAYFAVHLLGPALIFLYGVALTLVGLSLLWRKDPVAEATPPASG